MEQATSITVTVSSLFTFILGLLAYIWNKSQKSNGERLIKHELLIEELTKNSVDQKVLLTELTAMVKYHERDIQTMKS